LGPECAKVSRSAVRTAITLSVTQRQRISSPEPPPTPFPFPSPVPTRESSPMDVDQTWEEAEETKERIESCRSRFQRLRIGEKRPAEEQDRPSPSRAPKRHRLNIDWSI
jgi:hypothetical protein